MPGSFRLADNDTDDPIVWQVGRWREDGSFVVYTCRASDKQRLVEAFGLVWFEAHLADLAREVERFGIH